ncbi:MAG: hypothetical protein RLZZ182_1827 [Pseudomonadota bacterium]
MSKARIDWYTVCAKAYMVAALVGLVVSVVWGV